VMLDAPKQICLSGTNSNPDSLKVNIRLARGVSGGVGGAIGAELSVNDINLGAVARGDLYAGGAIFTEGKFRFPNPVPSQSDLDKAALFLMIEPEALVPVSQVLVPIAQFLSVFIQTPLTNSVEKGVVGYDIFGGGEGRAAVGLTHSNLPAGDLGGFGAQAQADATMHANLGFVKLPGTGFGVEGGAHGYVAAYGSADYNFAPNPWNRNIVKDLPADLGIYNWRTGSGQFLFEGMLDCGFGIYCDWQGPKAFMVYLTKEIGNNTETYEFWIDSDNIQRLRDFVAGISQDLLAGTINQLGLQNNVMNIFHARPETFAKSFYAVFERVIDFAQSGQGLRLTYYKYNSNSQDILPIRINLAVGLGIDAAIGLNWSIRNEKSLLTEEGTMLIGKKYKLYDYSDDIYTQTRNDVNTVPIQLAVQVLTGLLDDIFGVVAGIMPSKDGDSLILQVGTGTLVVRQGAIPPGDSVAIVSWVWQPETTADCYASKLRKFLQQQAGLTYGIGGFYQLQPEVANVNGKAKLKIAYADSEVVNIDESSLRLYRWNDSLRKWLYVGGVVHPDSNYVVKDSLMLFGLYTLAPAAPSDTFNLHLDPDSIPANGTSYSNATGGPIRLNTGQIVPDSTLITVTTSAGTITTPDADTTIPGIQVLTNNGNISFQIRAPNIATTSTVIARSVEGDAVGSAKIVFYDVARPSTPIISEAYASDSIMVRISWRRNNENDILGYKLYYDSDSLLPYQGHSPYDLPSPIDVGNDTTRILALPLHPDSNFYIRITAYDISRNESDYSEMVWVSGMQVFDTIAPSTPELIAPRPNSAVNDSLPRFVWRRPSDNLTGVSHYLLHYYNNFGIDTTIRINDTSAIPVIPLPDTIYFWQVKAFDWANNPSEWSEVWRFEIDTRGPTRPSLINPHNDTCLNHLNIAFEWTAVTGLGKERRNQPTALPMQLQKKIITEQKMDMIKTTDEMKFNDLIGPKMNDQTQITNMMKVFEASEVRYILEIDTNRLFTSPIFIETTAITYDTVNLFEDRFYWRVRAYDLAGNQGEFSDTFTFIADTTKPVVPILIYPTNNAPIRDTFVWHRATDNLSGIKGYRIQIAYDSLFNRLMLDSTLNNPNDTMIIFHPDSAGYWRVKSIDRAGNESNWSERRGYTGITEGEKKTMPLPSVFILYANQPNPFAKMTEIRYGIPIKTRLRITVYNSSGQEIATLINGIQSPGWYSVKWNGKDNKGNNCPAGIYFYRIESEEYKATKKMVKNE
ncbi:MAG: FlgD immunoglobulin-like domain containing protein, partial [candidate division WOR-3 bacterium]